MVPDIGQHKASEDESGPPFDFSAPTVVASSEAIVKAITLLRDALQAANFAALASESLADEVSPSGPESRDTAETNSAYLACIKILTAHMPGLYVAYDVYIEAVLGTGEKPVACRPSCPSCCAHYVTSVEPIELLFIDAALRERDDHADRLFDMHERAMAFRKVYDISEGDEAEDKALHRYFLLGKACPFLTGGGECGVRSFRPMSCRMFFSYSDPKYCAGRKIVSAANRNFHVGLPDEAEALLAQASSALSGLALSEHLFDGLLQVNEALARYGKPPTS